MHPACAATGTDFGVEIGLDVNTGVFFRFRRRHLCLQFFQTFFVSGRQYPVMTNLAKTFRQIVQTETAQKFRRCKRHGLDVTAICIIPVTERDFSVVHVLYAMVGDGDILRHCQIFQAFLWTI